jgi:ADP-ribose pyrophosphatase YjhB (NUDIX family)
MNQTAQNMFGKKAAVAGPEILLGVGVVVFNETGWMLLEKRNDCGWWGRPGGRIEPGESIADTAVREVRAESGLMIKIVRLMGNYSELAERIVSFDNGDVRHRIDVIVEAKIISGKLACSQESEKLQFFEAASLPAEICPPAIAPLEDYTNGRIGMIR